MRHTHKKILLVIFLFGIFSFLTGCTNPLKQFSSGRQENGSVALNSTNFPDSKLRVQLLHFDRNHDFILSAEELEAATELTLDAFYVREFTGLELLSNLQNLEISNANTHPNINAHYLEFVGYPSLKKLEFKDSDYLSLRVADNPNLTDFTPSSYATEKIVVENNPKLKSIGGVASENLLSLTITENTALKEIVLYDASNLTDLVITGSPNVEKLDFWNSQLIELDLTEFQKLQELNCTMDVKYEDPRRKLTTLDVSHNPDLRVLLAMGHMLTALDLTNNPKLEELECEGTMTELDLSNCPNLVKLTCQGDLKLGHASKCRNLQLLYVGGNQLRELDVTNNKKLYGINCGGNQLERLLFLNSEFENTTMSVGCSFNALATLDLTGYRVSMSMSDQRVSLAPRHNGKSGKTTIDLLQLMEQKDLERVEISKEQLEQLGGVFEQQRGIVTLDRLPQPDEEGDQILHYTYDTKNEWPYSDDLSDRYMEVGLVLELVLED